MRVLLVCAGGMSTSILMKKMAAYAKDVRGDDDFYIEAHGVGSVRPERVEGKYDCILMGPQVGYLKDQVVENAAGLPVDVMKPADYGIGNCPNIFKQIDALLAQ